MLMNSVKGSTKAQGFPLTLHDVMGDSRNTGLQPYKYIGKELDRTHGLDWYDHGARHYDPVTGRWNVMDALAEKYNAWSPYVSCGDDPVNAVGPDGKDYWVCGFFRLVTPYVRNKVVPLPYGTDQATTRHSSGCAYRQLRCCKF